MKLMDVIGKEYYLSEDDKYTDDDFLKMTSEELATFKAKVNLRITDTIDLIKEFKETRNQSWLLRKQYVVSVNQKMLPYINELLKKRYKQERTISDYFMDAAKVVLSPENFELILNSAGDMRRRVSNV